MDVLTKSSSMLEGAEAPTFTSNSAFDDNSEPTDFAHKEFSQKNLFADFYSLPLPSDCRSDNISHKKPSDEGYVKFILHEIKIKKQKVEYLQKRFG